MIDFISADNAMIQMFDGDHMVAEASTAKSICYFIQEYGLAKSVFASSSVDFASEYGFETDECANDLWDSGLKYYEMTKIN
jgi:hypothetical protein